jgi:predicted DNA-binding WGR domain protein
MMTQTVAEVTGFTSATLPTTLCLVSIDAAKNRYRFYRISRQRTLWDEDVLVQSWGRIGTDGRSRICFLNDPGQIQTLLAKLLRQRLQHRYQLVDTLSPARYRAPRPRRVAIPTHF